MLDIENVTVNGIVIPTERTINVQIEIPGGLAQYTEAVTVLLARVVQMAADNEDRVILRAEFGLVVGQGPARVVCNAVIGWAL